MLYGYARLPYVNYVEPILSARAPVFSESGKGQDCRIEVQNFGQVTSGKALLKIEYTRNGKKINIASGKIPALQPYEKTELSLQSAKAFSAAGDGELMVTIYSGKKVLSKFHLVK